MTTSALGAQRGDAGQDGATGESQLARPSGAARPLVVTGAIAAAAAAGTGLAALILLTRVDGIRLRLLARTFGVSYHALRQRRQRAEQRLREFLESDRDVSIRPISTLVSHEGTIFRPECPPAAAIDVLAARAA